MANHYRILIDVWSANPESLHSFFGALILGGWYTHLPVPDSIKSFDWKSDRTIGPEIRTWGGYLFPDMRILTTHGLIEVCEPGLNLPQFTANSTAERMAYLPTDGEHPGFIGPKASDHIASIIAESRAGIPWRFFQDVIDKYYDEGLRFFIVIYSHADVGYGGADGHLFYSVSDQFACDNEPLDGRSIHCIALTVPGYVTPAGSDSLLDGDGGDDLYLPRIDPEGNELVPRADKDSAAGAV